MSINVEDDYTRYRGKCKELSEAAVEADPTLTLVRGWYDCPFWGRQQHWWTKRPDGSVYDPTKNQFPSKGIGSYIEYDGVLECEYCSKQVAEGDAYIVEHHVYCSGECYYHDVM